MKKLLISLFCVILLSSCTHRKYFEVSATETILAEPYGLINEDIVKQDTVLYEVSLGSAVWSCILIETVVAPFYFVGWDLYQPVRLKNEQDLKKRL